MIVRKLRFLSYSLFSTVAIVASTAGCSCGKPPGKSFDTNASGISALMSRNFFHRDGGGAKYNNYKICGMYVVNGIKSFTLLSTIKDRLESKAYLQDNGVGSITALKEGFTYYVDLFIKVNHSSAKDPNYTIIGEFTFINIKDFNSKASTYKLLEPSQLPGFGNEIKFIEYNKSSLEIPS